VAKTLDNHGLVIKHGGAFRWNDEKWVFDWGKQVCARSWQVDRSEFDALLLDHAPRASWTRCCPPACISRSTVH
jgi:hypothetical protein